MLIGTYPPPYGGASVFVQRTAFKLRENGYDVFVYDYFGKRSLRNNHWVRRSLLNELFSWNSSIRLYHINDFSAKVKILFSLKAKLLGKKLVVSLHSYRKKFGPVKGFAQRTSLRLADEVWVNNSQVANRVLEDFRLSSDKVRILRHFLLPTPNEAAYAELDEKFKVFAEAHQPLIVSSAWKLMEYLGAELYGSDVCVKLLAELRKEFKGAGLVFLIGRVDDKKFFDEMTRLVKDASLEKDILDSGRRS